VVPRASLDAVEQKKVSCSCRESNLGRPAHSPSPYKHKNMFKNELDIRYKKSVIRRRHDNTYYPMPVDPGALNLRISVRYYVLVLVVMNSSIFCHIKPCSPLKVN
jgi:hypothetical protein